MNYLQANFIPWPVQTPPPWTPHPIPAITFPKKDLRKAIESRHATQIQIFVNSIR